MKSDTVEVVVRYPGIHNGEPDIICRAIIGRLEYRPPARKRTKLNKRRYPQVWHIVKWIDSPPDIYSHIRR